MKRTYQKYITEHFRKARQMLFLMGPRQVGKTTLSLALKEDWGELFYYNWDIPKDRKVIVAGPEVVAVESKLEVLGNPPLLILDELHKLNGWKNFLKALYDSYPSKAHILVTGSARLDVYQRGADSLMGRYFSYRMHPFSVAEVVDPDAPLDDDEELRSHPLPISDEDFQALWEFGGFPDPFLNRDKKFYRRWRSKRRRQLLREEMRDLTRIQELDQLELLADLLLHQAGQLTSYASLSRKVRVSDVTVRQWLKMLRSVYYCFEVRPWSKNVARALLKEPKYYLWDWSLIDDVGARAENLVASHLLKAVHFWSDHGFGDYELYYVRDKNQREVDFLVTRDGKPWMLVECKAGDGHRISPALHHFREQLQPDYTIQVAFDLPYVDQNCFVGPEPLVVPARTFLSQLV